MAEDVFGIVGTVQGGAFRVDEVVAEGGFAVVYRAYHSAFRASVALKCLKVPGALSESDQKEFLEKFREEAELLFRLSAGIPSVVRPLHVGTLEQKEGRFVPFIALEWLEGQTLDKMISTRVLDGRPPLDVTAAVKLLTPVADTLCRAHQFEGPDGIVSIIHRDLKPENIFIARVNGRDIVKVLDFGIAKVKNAATQIVGRQSSNESLISAFTPAYGAPEQWVPKRYGQTGPWTDVWGLALTVVETLCGHCPIEGDHAAMMGSAIDPVRRPTPRNEGVKVAAEIEGIFAQALAVDPRDRFYDVGAFWNALCRAVGLPQTVGGKQSLAPAAAPGPVAGPPPREPAAAGASPPGAAVSGQRPSFDSGGRTLLAPQDFGVGEVPDLVVGPKPPASNPRAAPPASNPRAAPPASNPRAAPPASKPRAAAAAPAAGGVGAPSGRRPPVVDPGAMFGSSFDSFDDDAPAPRIEMATGFGSGLEPFAAPPRPRAAIASAHAVRIEPQRKSLELGAPLKLFALAVLLMAGDWAYARFTGELLTLGPARMLWLAGPIAFVGVVQLLSRLLTLE